VFFCFERIGLDPLVKSTKKYFAERKALRSKGLNMFDNILMVTDLDGTLFDSRAQVSQKNMNAINEFRNNGGLFTIATGRAFSYSRFTANELELQIPAIVYNGAAVYDFVNAVCDPVGVNDNPAQVRYLLFLVIHIVDVIRIFVRTKKITYLSK